MAAESFNIDNLLRCFNLLQLIPEVNIKNVVSNQIGQEYELPIDWSWEFPREQLILGDKVGEGAFGEVLRGEAEEIVPGQGTLTVAVKSLKSMF